MRCAFECHRATYMDIGCFDFFFAETKSFKHVEVEIIQLLICETKCITAEIITQTIAVKGELDIECIFK